MDPSTVLLALDFGGTKLSAATTAASDMLSVAPLWQTHVRHFSPDDADRSYEQQAMLDLAHSALQGRQPSAVGVSFGGPVDFDKGLVRLSHHVAGWEATPLREMLATEFGAPVAVDNDANVAALGEYRFGAGVGVESLAYVTVSTGIGSGWILGGRPWRGHEGMAGEIGHMVIDPSGPRCLCGKNGCVERLTSGPFMAQDAAERLAALPSINSSLRDVLASGQLLTGRHIAEAAAAGDDLAKEILLRGARALGIGLGNATNLVNPQRFILGGGVTKSGALWWDAVRYAANETALPEVSFDIVPAGLGDDAPLWGAIALAQDCLEQGPLPKGL